MYGIWSGELGSISLVAVFDPPRRPGLPTVKTPFELADTGRREIVALA